MDAVSMKKVLVLVYINVGTKNIWPLLPFISRHCLHLVRNSWRETCKLGKIAIILSCWHSGTWDVCYLILQNAYYSYHFESGLEVSRHINQNLHVKYHGIIYCHWNVWITVFSNWTKGNQIISDSVTHGNSLHTDTWNIRILCRLLYMEMAHYGSKLVWVSLHITSSHYTHYAELSEDIKH